MLSQQGKTQQQIHLKEFEFYTRHTHDNIKQIDQLLNIVNSTIDTEKSYQKSLQKQLSSSSINNLQNPTYKNIIELLKINMENRLQKSQETQKICKQCQEELQKLTKINQEIVKQSENEYKIIERETLQQYNKLQKIKDKYYSISRDLELGFIQFQCMDQNLESNFQAKQKIQTKNQSLINDRADAEENYITMQKNHKFSVNRFNEVLQEHNQKIFDMASKTFSKIYKLFDNTLYKEKEQIDNQIRFINYAQCESSAIQMQYTQNHKNIKSNFQQYYQQKNFIHVKSKKKYRTFLTDYVESGLTKMKNSKLETIAQDPSQTTFISQEFKSSLQDYFKLYADQFNNGIDKLKLKYETNFVQNNEQDEDNQQQEQQQQQQNQDNRNVLQEFIQSNQFSPDNDNINQQLFSNNFVEQIDLQQQQNDEEDNEDCIAELNQQQDNENDENTSEQQQLNLPQQLLESEQDQNKNQIQQQENQEFLQELQNQEKKLQEFYETDSGETQSKELIYNLQKLVSQVLYSTHPQMEKIIQKKDEKDTQSVQKLMVMTCTLYTKQSDGKEVYLQENIQNHNIWKCIDLWESLVYLSIDEDIKKQLPSNNQHGTSEWLLQYKNLIQSNLLSIGRNMQEFKMSKESIKQLLTKFAHQYGLFEVQIQELIKFIENDQEGAAFMSGVSSMAMLNSYYSNQSTIKQQISLSNATTATNGESPTKPRIFTFGGSQPKKQ